MTQDTNTAQTPRELFTEAIYTLEGMYLRVFSTLDILSGLGQSTLADIETLTQALEDLDTSPYPFHAHLDLARKVISTYGRDNA
jgi:hypothetical protein